ncbi:MAG: class I SAM-dependent RNA methyltransferase [Clostridiales bacterium]|nr:class I SAM-dependent RNA methyltransferase [Clostridiales bacterium]
MDMELIATATFGLEAVVRREIENLGYDIVKTEDGKVTYKGDFKAIVKSNLWLRAADRVLLKMGETKGSTFEELFQYTKTLPWEDIIPADGCFVVSGTTVKSKLSSLPAVQRTIKKAIVERLCDVYGEDLPETGAEYPVRFTLLKDILTISIDTSGRGLHKRGYRVKTVEAPIKETLAAALVELSFWRGNRILVDPCCGSGTIPIEAAMIGRNIAPGLTRDFVCSRWECINEDIWKSEKKNAYEAINTEGQLDIRGFDIDPRAIESAIENGEAAGVDGDIQFERKNISSLRIPDDGAVIVTNPPYGERIGSKDEVRIVERSLKRIFNEKRTTSLFVITSDKDLEKKMGRKADRRRKLFNGRIETTYYQFHGEKSYAQVHAPLKSDKTDR